jgi:hypothetical protein
MQQPRITTTAYAVISSGTAVYLHVTMLCTIQKCLILPCITQLRGTAKVCLELRPPMSGKRNARQYDTTNSIATTTGSETFGDRGVSCE